MSTFTVPVNQYIDHTVLKATTTRADVAKVCAEAREYCFATVCVPPNQVKYAKSLLPPSETAVKVCTVIGFPFGYSCAAAKVAEMQQALLDGADELDVVANVSAIKQGDWDIVQAELEAVAGAVGGRTLKVIIESAMLTDDEIIRCCGIYSNRIDFLKTSTGYADGGASVHAVALFRANLPQTTQIKASGGIRDYATAMEMIQAGASRIGCSAGVAICRGAVAEGDSAY